MTGYPRYAIYYVPAASSALYRFGSKAIGYDVYTGKSLAFPPALTTGLPDWSDLTHDPRTYGFHGTLKAPFALAPGRTEPDLIAACRAFAATCAEQPLITPAITSIDRFIAVTPEVPNESLQRLARDCVTTFDPFRAPLTADDRARRKPESLSEAQRANLDRWGYPYVMEEFRFHMTLTGRLAPERCDDVVTRLRALSGQLDRLLINSISLLKQADQGERFQHLKTFEFGTEATADPDCKRLR